MTKRLSVAIIEDRDSVAQTLTDALMTGLELPDIRRFSDFNEAQNLLGTSYSPEVLVLDLFVDPDSPPPGKEIWDRIWRDQFFPVVVFTGFPDKVDLGENEPFVSVVAKGKDSEKNVLGNIKKIMPTIEALRELNTELRIAKRLALTAKEILSIEGMKSGEMEHLLVRTTRRRLAAIMDLKTVSGGQMLFGWEQYIFPSVYDSLFTGDILVEVGGDKNNPESFRLVLSPSCDMQAGKEKIDQILTCRCKPIAKFIGSISSLGIKKEDMASKLPRFLTQPHEAGLIPLPSLSGIVPDLSADLRDLELIPVGDISLYQEDKQFLRILSIDSPFREQIAWAYISIVGRPGMPDRDLKDWASKISA